MLDIKLTDIAIYPIKSTCGIQLPSSEVTSIGLSNDRCFVLVNKDNTFISQRKYPQMALISTELTDDSLLVSAPDFDQLSVPLSFTGNASTIINVWSDECSGFVADADINQWFSDYLNVDVKLVAYDKNKLRPTDPNYSSAGDHVSFADGFPLLLASTASLNDLNTKLARPVTMQSFRPNIVVNHTEPFAEDQWKHFAIGDVEFEAVKLCSRCVLTTVDPALGAKRDDQEPLKTLSQYRRMEGGVMFGINLIPRTLGTIKVGDKLQLL